MNKYNRWPVAIAVFYSLFVLILVAFVIYTRYQTVNLVSDDYYQQELIYQQQIDRIKRTDSLVNPVRWSHDEVQKLLTLHFSPELEIEQIQGQILFFRPSDAQQDKLIAINLTSDGSQKISTEQLTPGYWKLKIFWQLNGSQRFDVGGQRNLLTQDVEPGHQACVLGKPLHLPGQALSQRQLLQGTGPEILH